MNEKTDVGLLLERDLHRAHLTHREFAALLMTNGGAKITEQAVHNWKVNQKIPDKRVARVLEILGPDSSLKVYLCGANRPGAPDCNVGSPPVKADRKRFSALQLATLEALEKSMCQGGFSDTNCVQLLSQCVAAAAAAKETRQPSLQ